MDVLVEEGFIEDDCVENVPDLNTIHEGFDEENARAEMELDPIAA